MTAITISIKLYLVFYISRSIPNHKKILMAMAKATLGKVDLDENTLVDVTVYTSDIIEVYSQVMVIEECVSRDYNEELKQLLSTYLSQYPDLALQIMAIEQSNQFRQEQVKQEGKDVLKGLQLYMTNN